MKNIDFLTRYLRRYPNNMDPCVLLFDEKDRLYFEEAKRELKKQDYQLMNVNECAIISPEDYQISAKEAGFHAPEDVRVGDLLMDDEEKKSHITLVKLNRLLAQVNERTILVITYNDLYRRRVFYETVRHWLKDGYSLKRDEYPTLGAIVLVENQEGIRDFCKYGFRFSR